MADAGDLEQNCETRRWSSLNKVFTCLKVGGEEACQRCHPAQWRRSCRRELCCSSTSLCSRSPRPPDPGSSLECWMMAGVSVRTLRASSRAWIETSAALNRRPRPPPRFRPPLPASHKSHCGSACQEQEQPPAPDLPCCCLLPTRSACPLACTS